MEKQFKPGWILEKNNLKVVENALFLSKRLSVSQSFLESS